VENHNDQEEVSHYCEISSLMSCEREEKEDKSYHLCILRLRMMKVSQESR
jgi:hypothetical protein